RDPAAHALEILPSFDKDHEVALVLEHLEVLRGTTVDQWPIHPGAILKDTEVAEFGYSTLSPAQPHGMMVLCLRERLHSHSKASIAQPRAALSGHLTGSYLPRHDAKCTGLRR